MHKITFIAMPFCASAACLVVGDRKVLVHCQINLRASSMVILYRAIVLKEDPRVACEAVSRVWVPDAPWRRLIEGQLAKHKVPFELL